jgi:D-proline reductase (dithiol) PrdA
MAISHENIERYLEEPAVVCCLTEAGTIIGPENLEEPEVLPELVAGGFLQLPQDTLKVKEVLGKKIKKTLRPLTPVTPELIEEELSSASKVEKQNIVSSFNTAEQNFPIRVSIGEAKNITFEIPTSLLQFFQPQYQAKEKEKEKIKRVLELREYEIKKVQWADRISIQDGVLTLKKDIVNEISSIDPIVKKVSIDIIEPDKRDIFTNTILDVIPIATKVEGKIGEGITNILKGVVVILTGVDEDGIQIHEFGSCEGILNQKVKFGRPGCPDEDDIIIRVDVVIERRTGMERRGPYAAHKVCDAFIQQIREVLKTKTASEASSIKKLVDVEKKGRPRVVIVKEIMGQGAMHDNIILPNEPCGVIGGRCNVDLGNVPVVLSSNEVLDGAIHALTCVGPATKETTRHYIREPLVELLRVDNDLNLVGVVFVGSPQANQEKLYVSERLGMLIEAMGVDGAIVTTEGFGNNHIDFAWHIEQIGKRGIPVVGVTFAGVQGSLIVGNKYMDAMVELNKNEEGIESEILAENTLCPEDARRALAMLKTKMSGGKILPPFSKWDPAVIEKNQSLVDRG